MKAHNKKKSAATLHGRFFIAKKARKYEFVPFVNELVGINSNFVGTRMSARMLRRVNLHCVQHRERLRRARWTAKMRVGQSHCVQHKVHEWPPVHCAQRSSNVHNNKSMKPAQYL
uniref:60S ribosomal protein L32 n=1 Tax=Globodera rostochiensis TaxID=31243 RepID=A0A914IDH3_GLORO